MSLDNRSIIYISAEAVFGMISFIGNSIVLVAILRNHKLHTVTNVFVGNLAMADAVVGLLVAPLAALSFYGLPRNFYGCVLVNSLIIQFTNVSILMLLAVAIERFVAIKEPFTYQRIMTVRRAIFINMVVWVLGTLLGSVPVFGWNSGKWETDKCEFTGVITYEYMVYFQFFGFLLVPLFFMLCIYIYIIIIVRRHIRQAQSLHRQILHNQPEGNTTGVRRGFVENREERKFNKDVRAAKMFAVLILLFAISWFPLNIFNSLSLFCPVKCPYSYESLLVAIVLSHANSSFNPLVYAASNSLIRKAIMNMFRRSGQVQDTTTETNTGGRSTSGIAANRENMVQYDSDDVEEVDAVGHVTTSHSYGSKPLTFSTDTKSFEGKGDSGLISMQSAHDHKATDNTDKDDRYPIIDTPNKLQGDTNDDIYALTQASDIHASSSPTHP